MKKLILVNQKDQKIGEAGKIEAHLGKGKRHRAFTAILKNDQGEILMTKRSLKKPLWPTFWDFSFSSHPWVDEELEVACQRRAKQELGIKVKGFKELLFYQYHKRWSELFSEWEINHVLLAGYSGKLKPNPEEISEWKWLEWDQVLAWVKKEPRIMAPWVVIAIKKIERDKKKKHARDIKI